MNPLLRAVPLFLAASLWWAPGATAITIFSAAGDAPADILGEVNDFRAALGNPNNANNPGPLFSGRREINWDGGGSTATSPASTPFNGFQNTRGGQFTTPGTGFFQAPASGGAGGGLATVFANPGYATSFEAFSPVRLLVPVGSNITDAVFSIPGTGGATKAGVNGFGVVFTDVDLAGSTRIELYDFKNTLFASVDVAALPGEGTLSFLGLLTTGDEPQIVRARIFSGNAALGPSDGAGVDVVAMDDFVFGEPRSIPHPAAAFLLSVGMLAVGTAAWRRR
jgi:hypothetical protein